MLLSVPEVIVPPYPGITSAVGLLTSDLKYETIRTAFQVSTGVDEARMNADFEAMSEGLREQFANDGIAAERVRLERAADVRYVGQGYELRVEFPDGPVSRAGLERVYEAFHRQHEAEYGHYFAESPIEIVNVRLTGLAETPKIQRPRPLSGGSLESAAIKRGESAFRVDGELRPVDTSFYRRDRLPIGERVPGPAIILQTDSTTVVPPRCTFVQEPVGNLTIRIGEES